ncbi:LacI family DNA-binding transcriptional regulator [Aquibacillus albus]|uniref:DNA-binding LacI/PurR family transcriptional regulator n=1 Tax=Aquibacillus albus TaxID=1168171 RepID=A0ABS2MY52_9BACI|nr:LacI family DNA-binding transcriptional regulator [Aquibacillus albus]MBM7570816.1 DNA-binding LacI/PurR family transcriptional regulator [Aquibacillus albus]
MAVTIKDVAKKANVAPSTVSRVISDSPKISEKTKRKVRKVMEEMGYHINLNARVLVQQSSKTIGIVMKNSTSESLNSSFLPEVVQGISALCRKHDYSISLITGDSEDDIYKDAVQKVRGKRVDGMIILYSKEDDKVVPYLMESGIPFVVLGKPVAGFNKITFVDNDNIHAAREATEYLINLGHEKIAFIGDDSEYEVAKARFEGFNQAMISNGLAIHESYIKFFRFNPEYGKKATRELINLEDRPTAIVITDDLDALIVLSAIRDMDLRIPDDISIISFNNSVISRIASPPLTSVDIQIYELGYESARCLIEEIKEPSKVKKSVIIPTVIEERESCKPVNQTKYKHY